MTNVFFVLLLFESRPLDALLRSCGHCARFQPQRTHYNAIGRMLGLGVAVVLLMLPSDHEVAVERVAAGAESARRLMEAFGQCH